MKITCFCMAEKLVGVGTFCIKLILTILLASYVIITLKFESRMVG